MQNIKNHTNCILFTAENIISNKNIVRLYPALETREVDY